MLGSIIKLCLIVKCIFFISILPQADYSALLNSHSVVFPRHKRMTKTVYSIMHDLAFKGLQCDYSNWGTWKKIIIQSQPFFFSIVVVVVVVFFFSCKRVYKILRITTRTTSLFQIKYSLQRLRPQLAKAIRGGYKRKKKIV